VGWVGAPTLMPAMLAAAAHTVSRPCRVVAVARAGSDAWTARPPAARAIADAALIEQIRDIPARSRDTDGAPRVHAEVRLGLGVRVERKRVARLMREHGLQGAHRCRGRGLTRRDPAVSPAPDLVGQQFRPAEPDQLWVDAQATWPLTMPPASTVSRRRE
jgi:putative transposase